MQRVNPQPRLIRLWLEPCERSLRPSTLANYRRALRLHLLPALGAIPLASITRADVRRCLDGVPSPAVPSRRARRENEITWLCMVVWRRGGRNICAIRNSTRLRSGT
jgi:Phage integrase, N-terminal SAM-like domain